nr:E3 ubiquitin-protein ligase BRE1A-like [Solanum lycopersicum]
MEENEKEKKEKEEKKKESKQKEKDKDKEKEKQKEKEDNEKEKENQKEKAKAKIQEKKVEVVICDVKDCGLLIAAYAEFTSEGLEVPSCGLSAETLHMRYASLLRKYEILKARNGYVSNNEDPQRPRTKKAKIDENVVVTTID